MGFDGWWCLRAVWKLSCESEERLLDCSKNCVNASECVLHFHRSQWAAWHVLRRVRWIHAY